MNITYYYALFATYLAAYASIVIVVGTILLVLLIVGHWRMFTKAGEAGWKALVPIYSDYVLFRIVWNTRSFWIYMGASILAALLTRVGAGNFLLGIVSYIVSTVVLGYSVVSSIKTSLAYDKGMGFAIGLFFLPSVFTVILGFGNARYRGPQV